MPANALRLIRPFNSNIKSIDWLEKENFPTLNEIPGGLLDYRGMGCKKIAWQGTKVGLICFKNDASQVVHIFVIDRKDIAPSSHDLDLEKVLVRHDRETKGWRDNDHLYLLVGSEPRVKVGNLL